MGNIGDAASAKVLTTDSLSLGKTTGREIWDAAMVMAGTALRSCRCTKVSVNYLNRIRHEATCSAHPVVFEKVMVALFGDAYKDVLVEASHDKFFSEETL